MNILQCPKELKGLAQDVKGKDITKDSTESGMEEENQGCEIAEWAKSCEKCSGEPN